MAESLRIPPVPARLTDRTLPPYSYVPGLFPHPIRAPNGHMHGTPESQIDADDQAAVRAAHYWAVDLFNNGYYWEAHEAWEALWHAYRRSGARADFVKGLIKLSAAGVKAREGNAAGVNRHAQRAVELFRGVAEDTTTDWHSLFGITPEQLSGLAVKLANRSQQVITVADDAVADVKVSRVVPFVLNVEF